MLNSQMARISAGAATHQQTCKNKPNAKRKPPQFQPLLYRTFSKPFNHSPRASKVPRKPDRARSSATTVKRKHGKKGTDPDVEVGRRAGHVGHVSGQTAGAVDPNHGHHFEEGDVHQRHGRRVVVDQLEEVDSTLADKKTIDYLIDVSLERSNGFHKVANHSKAFP